MSSQVHAAGFGFGLGFVTAAAVSALLTIPLLKMSIARADDGSGSTYSELVDTAITNLKNGIDELTNATAAYTAAEPFEYSFFPVASDDAYALPFQQTPQENLLNQLESFPTSVSVTQQTDPQLFTALDALVNSTNVLAYQLDADFLNESAQALAPLASDVEFNATVAGTAVVDPVATIAADAAQVALPG